MTINTLPVVYLTASTEYERDNLGTLLAPYSWSSGEFGMMFTDEAFAECSMALSDEAPLSIKALLGEALLLARQVGAGDICLNYGIVG